MSLQGCFALPKILMVAMFVVVKCHQALNAEENSREVDRQWRSMAALLLAAKPARAFAHQGYRAPTLRSGSVPTMQEEEKKPKAEEKSGFSVKKLETEVSQYGLSKEGAGFNQFDPILALTQRVGRRFGLGPAVGIIVLLASFEAKDIVAALFDPGTKPGDGKLYQLEDGLEYIDTLLGSRAEEIKDGVVIAANLKVTIGETVVYDTAGAKPIAFKYGARPYQNVCCKGLELGILGMKPGGKRTLFIPGNLAPPGVGVPGDLKLKYEVELQEVLPNYL